MTRPRVACDSLVALANSTADGAVLFAKNSDRPAAECQRLVQVPRQQHARGAQLRCQYIAIEQVSETARLIGSQPFWLWGFEHGLNEHGVAIGNHTVFTKDGLSGHGLIGMDLVRLGLERGTSAFQATEVIAALVERYGQGGSGYVDKDWPYHNSFLIADQREAYVLETSDRRWALRRIETVGSASNHLTIGDDWDALSPGSIEHAVAQGWWSEASDTCFDFGAAYRDTSMAPDFISSGRHSRTCQLLEAGRGRLTPASLRTALRDHYDSGQVHRPGRAVDDERYYSVCMHADPVGTTTASMIARLGRDEEPLVYWGSLGSPCVSVFLPYYIDGDLPAELARGGEHASADSPWWQFEELLTLVERDFETYGPRVRAAWDRFEGEIESQRADAEALARRDGPAVLTHFMERNVRAMVERLSALLRELH
ncbi:MAG: C69 family dipeptidase [Deltaproteobacteria bacterium]|nr:C69 family dipeptidase [Deltaproteobacteria bacterium]MBI3390945.1 C69 family dipeptidase [Deltaproteobacteria bacterium]